MVGSAEMRTALVTVVSEGVTVRDAVTLQPLEITEAADVSSVAVEATVVDAAGRFVGTIAYGENPDTAQQKLANLIKR